MYIPSVFRVYDPGFVRSVVRQNPFATLVSVVDGEPFATHLPVLLMDEDGRDVLVAHLAKANPQWRSLSGKVLVVFGGPHGYVSPSWYTSSPHVPTWNYVAVHATGTPEIVDGEEAIGHLLSLVSTFDPDLATTHPEGNEPGFIRSKLNGLVAFRIPVDRWEAKAKLSQNKPEKDRMAVREKYTNSQDPLERAMAEFM